MNERQTELLPSDFDKLKQLLMDLEVAIHSGNRKLVTELLEGERFAQFRGLIKKVCGWTTEDEKSVRELAAQCGTLLKEAPNPVVRQKVAKGMIRTGIVTALLFAGATALLAFAKKKAASKNS